MIFSWFEAREMIEFGEILANSYEKQWRELTKMAEHKQESRRQKLIRNLFIQAEAFSESRKINFFQKAKFANSFKWRLTSLGHEKDSIESLTRHLLFAFKQ